MSKIKTILMFIPILVFILVGFSATISAQVTGAIFTTDVTCTGTDLNIYGAKADVYIDGGPRHPGAAGLPDGFYYVKVTSPEGLLLGTSVGSGNPTPVHVTNGDFDTCYQLVAILIKASDGTPGYDTTDNAGGVYKVWVSTEGTFTNSNTKTDNFKVRGENDCTDNCGPQEEATLRVRKFYDANANGILDGTEGFLTGWKFNITDGINIDRFTPIAVVVLPDTYTVTEYMPTQTNWINTNPGGGTLAQSIAILNGQDKTLDFGNVCLGAGGGMTLGFWSNKNGLALVNTPQLCALRALNLRNANGTDWDPTNVTADVCLGTASLNANQLRDARNSLNAFLLSANATNMANMLSAQLAAMKLNVLTGKVSGSALIYAPGVPVPTVNSLGFGTVDSIMAAANIELGLHPDTTSGSANDSFRPYQEALKNALDRANNNLNFVQSSACPFTF